MNRFFKHTLLLLGSLLVLFLGCNSLALASTPQEWVVVLEDPRPARLQGWQASGYTPSGGYASSLELKRLGNRFAKRYGLELKQQWFIESLSVYCLIVEIKQNPEETLARLNRDDKVKWVQISNNFTPLQDESNKQAKDGQGTLSIGAKKEEINKPKNLSNSSQKNSTTSSKTSSRTSLLNLPEWIDGRGIDIAIVDSAVDKQHMDLQSAVRSSVDFVLAGGEQNLIGESHGTAIAGVLVAQPKGEIGIAGIAPAARLSAFRGCWEELSGNTLSLARALDAVTKSKPTLLNLSLSGPEDRLLDNLIEKIVANNTLVVAAFDPQRPNVQRFPSRRSGVLIVRAETLDQEYQNEFTAPGGRLVTSPGNRYDYVSGHSIATAYTSGVLALLAQAWRADSPKKLAMGLNEISENETQLLYQHTDQLLDRVIELATKEI